MFQRIARRHADQSDGRDAPAGEPAPPPSDDAPTERIEAVAPATGDEQPAAEQPAAEQPTALQPAVSPPAQPPAPPTSVPPPKLDLRSRIPGVEASVAQPAAAPAQPSPTAPTVVATPAPVAAESPAPTAETAASEVAPRRPGFRARGRMRRRLRYLRKLRELQVRDLGGLVFDLRRFERKRDDLVLQKIDQIRACDDELHALERALGERRDLRDVREPGIGGTCPRCFAIFGSADKFCSNCGAALGGAVQGPARSAQVPPAPPPPASDGGQPG